MNTISKSQTQSKLYGQEKLENLTPADLAFIQQAKTIIQYNIDNDEFKVSNLAKELFLSISQLNRRLTFLINISAGNLIRKIRMNHAACMLSEKDISVGRVAFAVGYKSQANFCRCFKQVYGIAPSKLFKQKRKR